MSDSPPHQPTSGTSSWRAAGDALADAGEHARAVDAYRAAMRRGDEGAEVHHNLARVLYRLGDVDAAVDHLRTAVALGGHLGSRVALSTVAPLAPSVGPDEALRIRRDTAARLGPWTDGAARMPRPDARPTQGSRLRLGFVSAFFHKPNYMKPVWALLNELPRNAWDVHFFSDAPDSDPWPGYRTEASDQIHATADLSTEDVVALIRAQRLDVLVDLNGYSAVERLDLYLAAHAPLTVAWFNTFATTGLPGIDVVVGDAEVVSPDEEAYFSERVERLPGSYLAFTVGYEVPEVTAPPCLRNEHVTFGSLAPLYKITPPVFDAWAEILRQAPEARLFIANTALGSLHNRAWVLERLVERGIRTGRVDLEGPAEHTAFLEKYARVDIALDTFPYSGGTTTMEALWQGVPVLALLGDRWAARTSRTLLHHAGMDDWTVPDVSSLVDRAAALARRPETPEVLAGIRRTMRERLSASGACDAKVLASGFAALLMRLTRPAPTP